MKNDCNVIQKKKMNNTCQTLKKKAITTRHAYKVGLTQKSG